MIGKCNTQFNIKEEFGLKMLLAYDFARLLLNGNDLKTVEDISRGDKLFVPGCVLFLLECEGVG
jgi:hypothetical protein